MTIRNGLARGSRLVLPAVAALGIGGPASAFELGALDVHSTLGQPLRASIAFALNPGEEIQSYCIYLNPARPANGLPSGGPASVVVENGAIRLFGETAVSDPLLALRVTIDCPYAAHLSREFVAFVDPAVAVAASRPAAAEAPRTDARPAPVTARRPAARAPVAAIAAAARYRVQPGDSLSGIAQRLSGRSVTIWQAVEALYATNPDAFIDNNRDLLKAGALLRIPDAIYAADGGALAARPAPSPQPAAEQAEAPQPAYSAYSGYRSEAERIESGRAARAAAAAAAAAPAIEAERAGPRPAGSDASPVSQSSQSRQAPDPRAEGGPFVEPDETAGAAAADVTPAAILPENRPVRFEAPLSREGDNGGGAWVWLMWLGGSGIGLILALLLLGRPLRRRFGGEAEVRFDEDQRVDQRRERGAAPVTDTPEPLPISALAPAAETSGMEVDFHVHEGPADARLIMVDGDVEDGSGFQDGGDIDVAQDFGFSASGGVELGLEVDFPEEPAAAPGTGDTNVIAPIRRVQDFIVEEEIPPGSDETGAYDVSMIVDATQQPIGDSDDTARDLHAIELDTGDAAPEDDPYTLSREVDYKILEQDYQEELTATQALNAELSNAVRDLAERLDSPDDDAAAPDAPTAEFPTLGREETVPHPAAVRALADADTVEMPGKNDDDEDTGVNEELKDLPAAQNDATAEMEIESATVERKKKKAS